jgi:hypothetical protein
MELHATSQGYTEDHFGINRNRWWIHPGSLHILEPRESDWLYLDGQMYQALGVEREGDEAGRAIIQYEGERGWLSPRAKIIQRNGKAFHWPESEEA